MFIPVSQNIWSRGCVPHRNGCVLKFRFVVFVGLRLLGIGRNQYIDLMNQCRSSKVGNTRFYVGHRFFRDRRGPTFVVFSSLCSKVRLKTVDC